MTNSWIKRVFISSTNKDLAAHRDAVKDELIRLGFFPEMNEDWPAMPSSAVKACMDKVDSSDIYIGIFAHWYGHCPPDSDVSITEMEFNRAIERNLDMLCFIVDETFMDWPTEYIENEPGRSKLASLKSRISRSLLQAKFSTPETLLFDVNRS